MFLEVENYSLHCHNIPVMTFCRELNEILTIFQQYGSIMTKKIHKKSIQKTQPCFGILEVMWEKLPQPLPAFYERRLNLFQDGG